MGTPIEQPGSEEVQDVVDNVPGLNPAWQPVLELLPEQFHTVVTPHFQKWDKEAQSRIETANNSLKEFEAYKPLLEHGITFDEVSNGLRLAYELNNNPENVYNALVEAYKFGQQPQDNAPASGNEESEEDDLIAKLPPEIKAQLGQQGDLLQTVAQIVLNDAQAKQQATADKELDDELNAAREKFGEYDEKWVLSLMQASNISAEEAVQEFVNFKQSLAPKPFAPTLLGGSTGGGAGIPSNAIDPTKLSGKETRNLVVEMLAKAAQQNQ